VIVSEYTVVDRVQKFSAQGRQLITAWGTPGLAAGEFNRAEGVCVDNSDRIYVADSCNHRIQVFSPEGKFLRAYGKAGEGAGEMSYPYDIQVDEQGRQFVCEFGNSRIQVFDLDGRSVETIGKAGAAPGQFNNPWSIALDSKGNLYVADSQNHRVQKLIRGKHQTSNTKHQQTLNFQPSNLRHSASSFEWKDIGWYLGFGGLLVFGVWCLVFRSFAPS
jgi:DNA-binding beta-propeller fold protein YncE